MMKTRELSENINSSIITKAKTSEEYGAILKDLGVLVTIVHNFIRRFTKHVILKNLHGHRKKK